MARPCSRARARRVNGAGSVAAGRRARVAELQAMLQQQDHELTRKNAQAEERLGAMVGQQQQAQAQQAEAEAISARLAEQRGEIAAQQAAAGADLNEVEPMLEAARRGVSGIKKAHLDELRHLGKPPEPVQLAMEGVRLLLSGEKEDWDAIRRAMGKGDFIQSILQFDSRKLEPKLA